MAYMDSAAAAESPDFLDAPTTERAMRATYNALAPNDTLNLNLTLELSPSAADNSTMAAAAFQWGVLSLSLLIVATAVGNILVCLAVCWEKRLQNMTNYFLMSLAIADLLVALLVMPFGLIVELYGKLHNF